MTIYKTMQITSCVTEALIPNPVAKYVLSNMKLQVKSVWRKKAFTGQSGSTFLMNNHEFSPITLPKGNSRAHTHLRILHGLCAARQLCTKQ